MRAQSGCRLCPQPHSRLLGPCWPPAAGCPTSRSAQPPDLHVTLVVHAQLAVFLGQHMPDVVSFWLLMMDVLLTARLDMMTRS